MSRPLAWIGERVRRPIDVREVIRDLSVIFMMIFMVTTLLYLNAERGRERERFETERAALVAELDARDATVECRARLSASLSDAEITFLLAIGELVEDIADETNLAPAIDRLRTAGAALREALEIRLEFEEAPTELCPT